jgi:hypothetical protein
MLCSIGLMLTLTRCSPPEDLDLVLVHFVGTATDARSGEGIDGLKISAVEEDSLRSLGLQTSLNRDSTENGVFNFVFRVDKPGTLCKRPRRFQITLRFDDPLERYSPALMRQELCRYTQAEIDDAMRLRITLVPISQGITHDRRAPSPTKSRRHARAISAVENAPQDFGIFGLQIEP